MFGLLQAYAFLKFVQGFLGRKELRYFFMMSIVGVAGMVFVAIVVLTYMGNTSNRIFLFSVIHSVTAPNINLKNSLGKRKQFTYVEGKRDNIDMAFPKYLSFGGLA